MKIEEMWNIKVVATDGERNDSPFFLIQHIGGFAAFSNRADAELFVLAKDPSLKQAIRRLLRNKQIVFADGGTVTFGEFTDYDMKVLLDFSDFHTSTAERTMQT